MRFVRLLIMFDIDIKLLKQKEVTSRKEHECWECATMIPKGSSCISETFRIYGDIETAYRCETCYKIRSLIKQMRNKPPKKQGDLLEAT